MVGQSPFLSVRAKTWRAKSAERQLAEIDHLVGRSLAHDAKERWKTAKQRMYNNLADAMDSEHMVSRHGPNNWQRELATLGLLNDRLHALSTIPPYTTAPASYPVPVVDTVHPAPMMAVSPSSSMPWATPALAPAPMAVPAPVRVPVHTPALASQGLVDDVPVTVNPTIAGYLVSRFIEPIEAVAPLSSAYEYDPASHRVAAVELLIGKASWTGANAIVNLRLETTAYGDVVAVGDAVVLLPE